MSEKLYREGLEKIFKKFKIGNSVLLISKFCDE